MGDRNEGSPTVPSASGADLFDQLQANKSQIESFAKQVLGTSDTPLVTLPSETPAPPVKAAAKTKPKMVAKKQAKKKKKVAKKAAKKIPTAKKTLTKHSAHQAKQLFGQNGPSIKLKPQELNDKERAVLFALAGFARDMALEKRSIGDLAEMAFPDNPDKNASWVRNALRRLYRAGFAQKAGRGEYRIAKKAFSYIYDLAMVAAGSLPSGSENAKVVA